MMSINLYRFLLFMRENNSFRPVYNMLDHSMKGEFLVDHSVNLFVVFESFGGLNANRI